MHLRLEAVFHSVLFEPNRSYLAPTLSHAYSPTICHASHMFYSNSPFFFIRSERLLSNSRHCLVF